MSEQPVGPEGLTKAHAALANLPSPPLMEATAVQRAYVAGAVAALERTLGGGDAVLERPDRAGFDDAARTIGHVPPGAVGRRS